MELKFHDRIMILSVIPKKGNFEKLIISEDVRKKVEITQEEIKEYNIQTQENGSITWSSNEKTIPVEFSELESSLIKEALKEIDEKKELTNEHLTIYRLFVTKE